MRAFDYAESCLPYLERIRNSVENCIDYWRNDRQEFAMPHAWFGRDMVESALVGLCQESPSPQPPGIDAELLQIEAALPREQPLALSLGDWKVKRGTWCAAIIRLTEVLRHDLPERLGRYVTDESITRASSLLEDIDLENWRAELRAERHSYNLAVVGQKIRSLLTRQVEIIQALLRYPPTVGRSQVELYRESTGSAEDPDGGWRDLLKGLREVGLVGHREGFGYFLDNLAREVAERMFDEGPPRGS